MSRRKPDSNKGDYGRLLVVAGSLPYSGAALLCAHAALRAGAGLVTIGVPKGIAVALTRAKPREAMLLPLPQTNSFALSLAGFKDISRFAGSAEAVAIGPGMGQDPSTASLVRKVIAEVRAPLVVDADALNACAGRPHLLRQNRGGIVVTPHPGEMARLLGASVQEVQAQRIVIAKKFAKDYNCITVLKGHMSVVADPLGKVYVNRTGNPGMATAGSGDVLTGIIAAFICQGLGLFDAAKYGVYLHGLAGDIAAKKKSQISLIASDIIDTIHTAIRKSL